MYNTFVYICYISTLGSVSEWPISFHYSGSNSGLTSALSEREDSDDDLDFGSQSTINEYNRKGNL
jgi:hypothetical protein